MNYVYLNGHIIRQDQAMVSAMDRGFLFGDGVYEVLPVYNGKVFRNEQHLDRLFRSLDGIKLNIDLTKQQLSQIFETLIQKNQEQIGSNQSIYLQVTRGYCQERNHAFPAHPQPTIFAFSYPLKTVSLEILASGMSAITLEDTRWQYCNIKATSLLPNILLYQKALDKGCAEAILIRDGNVEEGATSNLFIISKGIIKTPPLSNYILGGVTRDLVLELARDHGFNSKEEIIPVASLFEADEVWITSSTREIFPIIKVNETLINQGKPGPIWHKMIRNYHEYIKSLYSI